MFTRLKRFFLRLFRRIPAPGRFEADSKFSWRGFLATAPFVWPKREYLVYVPAGWSRWRRAPLLVLCHGCKQTPEEIAAGTRITAFADREGWLVLLPRQNEDANVWRCWNWFESRTADGNGEAAIVAAQIEAVASRFRADPRRIVAAGMSAGGALASVLALRHPEIVRFAFVHSGVACGAAASPMSAISVMKSGPDTDIVAIAAAAQSAAPRNALPVPLLAIQGDQDGVVAPRNAIALVRQFLRLNGHPAMLAVPDLPPGLPAADAESSAAGEGGRIVTTRDWRVGGRLVVRFVSIGGLDHAWSGGDAALPYNDPRPPDALSLLALFAREAAP